MSDAGEPEDPEVARLREQLAAAERVAELRAELAAAETDLKHTEAEIAKTTTEAEEKPELDQITQPPSRSKTAIAAARANIDFEKKDAERIRRQSEFNRQKDERRKNYEQQKVDSLKAIEQQRARERWEKHHRQRQVRAQEMTTQFFLTPKGKTASVLIVVVMFSGIVYAITNSESLGYDLQASMRSAPSYDDSLSRTDGGQTRPGTKIDCLSAGDGAFRVSWNLPEELFEKLEVDFGDGGLLIWSNYSELSQNEDDPMTMKLSHEYSSSGSYRATARLWRYDGANHTSTCTVQVPE